MKIKTIAIALLLCVLAFCVFFLGFWWGCAATVSRFNKQMEPHGIFINKNMTVIIRAEKFRRPKAANMLRPVPGSVRHQEAKLRVRLAAKLSAMLHLDTGANDPTIGVIQSELVRRRVQPTLKIAQNRIILDRSQ